MQQKHLALFIGLLLAAAAFGADERPRIITVGGHGTAIAEPDQARVSMAVQKLDLVMSKAREDVLGVTRKFLALCQKLGIDQKKVRTSGLIVRPEYRWDNKNNQQVLIGYSVQRNLEVQVDDLERLGQLVEGAVDAGVNQVLPPELDSSRRRELHREALSAAAKDAQANATTIAATLGARLGPIRELAAADVSAQPVPMVRALALTKESADGGGAATYSTGTLRFEGEVTAIFDLLPN